MTEAGEAEDAEDDEEDGDVSGERPAGGGVGNGVLTRKAMTAEERRVEQQEYSAWLREQLAKSENQSGAVDDSVTLRRYMEGERLDADERFLRTMF